MKKIISTEWFLMKFMFETDMMLGILYWFICGIQYTIPLINVWIWKLVIDQLTEIYLYGFINTLIWVYIGSYLFLNVFSSILREVGSIVGEKINRLATRKLDLLVMQKMAYLDIGFFDNPQNDDKIVAAQTSETYITGNMSWVIETVIGIISFTAGLIMFLSQNVVFGLVYMATYIPGAIFSYKHRKQVDQWSLNNIPETRKKDYYKSLLVDEHTAKDLRLYNLANYFKSKYNELWTKIRHERELLFVKGSVVSFFASLLTYMGIVAILLISVRSVILGTMEISMLVLYIGLAETSGERFKQIVENLGCQIDIDVPRVICFLDFLQCENEIKDTGTSEIPDYPEIEFRNVYFRYPGKKEYVLNNLNLKIESGKKVALVGVNGAGKTTLVKLLLRFYQPESGEILIGGKNIQSYSSSTLNRLFGVCFQNVQKYSLSLRENIAVSDISRLSDDDGILAAATAAGADGICKSLPDGIDTNMTRRFDNKGVELSGGQWQKIAIARAFFRDAQFIILDEPSSALDPEAEDCVFSSFGKLCKNKGGILISHRLSSIMMVDEIILLDKGSVLESGTHSELMKMKGKYAEMYSLQAEKYVGGTKNEQD